LIHLTPILALAEEAGGASLLTPDGSLLLILLMFLAFVPVLNRILFKPVSKVLAERERLTAGSSRDAENILNTIDQKLADYESEIRSARSEGYKLVEQRRQATTALRQGKIDGAHKAAEERLSSAKAQLAADAASARATLVDEATEIANKISSTVLGRAVGGGN